MSTKDSIYDFKTSVGFERLYNDTADQMFTIIYNQLGNTEVTEGIVQNIFMRLWERRHVIKLQGPIENYLNRAAKLATLEYIRTRMLRCEHSATIFSRQERYDDSVESLLMLREMKERLQHAVNGLPPQCRKVYILSREEGLSIREIASALIIAEKTAEAHLTKALRVIRTYLGHEK